MSSQLLPWLSWGAVAAVVLWLMLRALRRTDDPRALVKRWLYSALIMGVVGYVSLYRIGFEPRGDLLTSAVYMMVAIGLIAAGGILLGVLWAEQVGTFLARPLTNLFDEGGAELRPTPLYSAVEARRKQGRPAEALDEARRQLERFPGDFRGTLLCAQIQAEDFKDLGAAEATLRDWMAAAKPDPGNRAVALHKLAEWHLHLGRDVATARARLQEIIDAFPGTEAAMVAEQRLAHVTERALAQPGLVPVPTYERQEWEVTGPMAAPPKPSTETADLVRHLQQHPHDASSRQRLAYLYAWEHGRPELARGEFEALLAIPKATPRQIGQWLNQLADMEIQVGRNLPAARAALERLIAGAPKSAAADQARTRIHLLPRELARHSEARVVGAWPGEDVPPRPRF